MRFFAQHVTIIRCLYPKTRKRFVCILLTFLLFLFISNVFVKNPSFMRETNSNSNEDQFSTVELLENPFHSRSKSVPKKTMPVMHQYQDADFIPEIVPSVLIFTTDHYNKDKASIKLLKLILNSLKISFYFVTWNRPEDNFLVLPRLQDKFGNARYHTFIFTNHLLYDELDLWTRNIINEHCKAFKVGIIVFADAIQANAYGISEFYQLRSIPVAIKSGAMKLYDFEIAFSSVYKIIKPGNILPGWADKKHHSIFLTDNPSFEPMAFWKFSASQPREDPDDDLYNNATSYKVISMLFDKGTNDGIQKILFGTSFDNSWLHQLILVDSLMALSNGVLGFGIERFIQVDIDDVFVGTTGKKLVKSDVEVLYWLYSKKKKNLQPVREKAI